MTNDIGNWLPFGPIIDAGGRSILLIRHGQTAHNQEHRFNGRGETALNSMGQQQATALAMFLQRVPLAGVWSSPLLRARQTAAPLLEGRSLTLQVDERLSELDQGALEGERPDVLQARYPAFLAAWLRDPTDVRVPGGETMRELQERMLAALRAICAQAPAGGPPVAVISHNMAIAAALCGLDGKPLSAFRSMVQKNTAVTLLAGHGGSGTLQLHVAARGVRVHLEGANESPSEALSPQRPG